jgi:capsular polysaccharide transport system permease protein
MSHLKSLAALFKNVVFLASVLIPTLLATAYYGFIASDIYISESRFVVRSPQRQQSSSLLSNIFSGSAFSKSHDDAHAVKEYILSRDALKSLENEMEIKKLYSSDQIDFIKRFGGLGSGNSTEHFHQFYKKIIDLQLDPSASIVTLNVRAFTPQDAQRINQKLILLAENMANGLNDRGRQDLIKFSMIEFKEAEKKAKIAAIALSRYRNEQAVIDPEKQSTLPLQRIDRLQDELLSLRLQILQLESTANASPQLPSLKLRYKLIENEIQSLTSRVVGFSSKSLATKNVEYQQLFLEKDIADKLLSSAMTALENARTEAQRKQIYIERIVEPSLADASLEPRRYRSMLAILIVSLISWGILSLLIIGVKEHND